MMIGENERFKESYERLLANIENDNKPLIVTEGKTDAQHIQTAITKLGIDDLDIDFYQSSESMGDSNLDILLTQLAKIPQPRKIIGIFDRDNEKIIKKYNQEFINFGNNVYGFCIPTPESRKDFTKISIEFYYSDEALKKKSEGKCLYFDNELNFNRRHKPLSPIRIEDIEEDFDKQIFCTDVGNLDWIHSKAKFADLIETNEEFCDGIDFSNFGLIINILKKIVNNQ